MRIEPSSATFAGAGSPARRLAAMLGATAGTRAFLLASLLVLAVVGAGALITWRMLEAAGEVVARQVIETMTAEADGIAALAEAGGPTAAIEAVARHARDGKARIYLLEASGGARLAGNLDRWPSGLARTGHGGLFEYRRQPGEATPRQAAGVVRTLPSGMLLLAGRDLEPQHLLAARIRWLYLTGFGGLAIAGLLAGLLASRLVLGRIGEITRTSEGIMTGDLGRRVPLTGTGDELDRLAANLNAMLDRIESLMAGMREVSDNIAHDLKTPLTRLRARAEAALRTDEPCQARDGLARVIEDADEVIKTFNALLLIARLEAGALEGASDTFDIAQLVRDVAELYEPVAEEAGLTLLCDAEGTATLEANRQLVGQAIANLVDNAIKYGQPAGDSSEARRAGEVRLSLSPGETEVRVTVADHGPGIPAVDRERVLRRFVRLEASRSRPGTGLGLSLVAAVARLHGGHIALADNAPGLVVVLALPRAKRSASTSMGGP